jgi:hypothetical protein
MEPETLELIGGPFDEVEEVHINERVSPSIIQVSRNKLWAQVPPDVKKDSYTVAVLTPRLFFGERSLYRFRLGTQPRLITGFPRLVQTFLRVLLQTPGSSLLNEEVGGGLLASLRSTYSPSDVAGLASQAYLSVQKAASDVLVLQTRVTGLSRSERLSSASVRSCYADPRSQKLYLGVDLVNQEGTRLDPLLQL